MSRERLVVQLDDESPPVADPTVLTVTPSGPPRSPGPGPSTSGPTTSAGRPVWLVPALIVFALTIVTGLAVGIAIVLGNDNSTNVDASRAGTSESGEPDGSFDVEAEATDPGPGSVDAYCAEVEAFEQFAREQGAEIEAASEGNPLEGLVVGLAALGDIDVWVGRLRDAAPDEIRADLDEVYETVDAGEEVSADNPLGQLAEALARSLLSSGSFQRVDDYTEEHCGTRIFGAPPDSAPVG